VLNIFRTLIYPSSGACDYSVGLSHWSVFLVRCVLVFRCVWAGVVSVLQAAACNTDTIPTQPHRISNTLRTKNNTTNALIQQNSRKLMMIDILMSETCWAHKIWNKIASDIKLVFYSSTITMMHGPINITINIDPCSFCYGRTASLNVYSLLIHLHRSAQFGKHR